MCVFFVNVFLEDEHDDEGFFLFHRKEAELLINRIKSGHRNSLDLLDADIDACVYLGMFNTHSSVETFARACFAYALNRNFPLKMSSKNTILKKYDGLFVDTFERVYREEYFA